MYLVDLKYITRPKIKSLWLRIPILYFENRLPVNPDDHQNLSTRKIVKTR